MIIFWMFVVIVFRLINSILRIFIICWIFVKFFVCFFWIIVWIFVFGIFVWIFVVMFGWLIFIVDFFFLKFVVMDIMKISNMLLSFKCFFFYVLVVYKWVFKLLILVGIMRLIIV